MAEGMLAASNRVISVLCQTQNLLKPFNWAFAKCREAERDFSGVESVTVSASSLVCMSRRRSGEKV